MESGDILAILADVPDYESFLTVDELNAGSRALAERWPRQVQLLPIGHARSGEPLQALRIEGGPSRALLFALPHPNEPIGSLTLEYLAGRLAEDAALREGLGYTWYLVKCSDPDGTRLNEGWFKGPFTIPAYARSFYRPPFDQQVEWTFPIEYKTLRFDSPLPETRALMQLIERVRPDFLYSLHNAGFGGVYFYLSEAAPGLYADLQRLAASQGLPLHLGEPEMPYLARFAEAVYASPRTTDLYDYLAQQTAGDPAASLRIGAGSLEYAQAFGDPFGLMCEMPYFYSPLVADTRPAGVTRREALVRMAAEAQADLAWQKDLYAGVAADLTLASPFRAAVEDALAAFGQLAEAQAHWARTDPATLRPATVAENFDCLVIQPFYRLLRFGIVVRMLEAQLAATGPAPRLQAAHVTALAEFERRSDALLRDLAYSAIPIRTLVRVQLGSALVCAQYAAGRARRRGGGPGPAGVNGRAYPARAEG